MVEKKSQTGVRVQKNPFRLDCLNELGSTGSAQLSQLLSYPNLKAKIHELAQRLEALKEYNPEQALIVAAHIVRFRIFNSHFVESMFFDPKEGES